MIRIVYGVITTMSPNYDKFDYCKYCGVFLGDDYREDHWCPLLENDDSPRQRAKDEVEELNFDREGIDDD